MTLEEAVYIRDYEAILDKYIVPEFKIVPINGATSFEVRDAKGRVYGLGIEQACKYYISSYTRFLAEQRENALDELVESLYN